MRYRKHAAVLLAVTGAALTLAGCSNKSSTDETPAPPPPPGMQGALPTPPTNSAAPPTAAGNPGVRMIQTGVVILRWNPSSGATSYNVYKSDKPGGEGTKPYASKIPKPMFTDKGLTIGNTYYYKVASVTATATSALSSELPFVATAGPTPPGPAPGTTHVSSSDGILGTTAGTH